VSSEQGAAMVGGGQLVIQDNIESTWLTPKQRGEQEVLLACSVRLDQ